MQSNNFNRSAHRSAGYTALIERYDIEVIPHWHTSFVGLTGTHRIDSSAGITLETFPANYWPGETPGEHLAFALKYDGVNLAILAALFQQIPAEELVAYIRSKPTGKYARRLWFLYEMLTGDILRWKMRNRVTMLISWSRKYTIPSRRPAKSGVSVLMIIYWETVLSARSYGAPRLCMHSSRKSFLNAANNSFQDTPRNCCAGR